MSGDVVLVDEIGGNMYFKLKLNYVLDGRPSNTHFNVLDNFHAEMTMETTKKSFTKFEEPLEIGTYQDKKLYIDVAVEPCLDDTNNTHRVTISFYTEKNTKGEGDGTR